MLHLTTFYEWFHNYYRNFYSSDPTIMDMVKLKEKHSVSVAKNARQLAQTIGLSIEKVNLAELIGLFHDIARSEQAHLKTFNDAISFDHGARGVTRLKEAGILNTLDAQSQEIVLFAIHHHNKMTVPQDTPEKMQFAHIIKDADKLDIFKVLPSVVAEHNYSPVLVELLKEGKVLPFSEIKVLADKKLIRLAWFYDIKYQWTLSQLVKEGHADTLLKSLPDTPPFDEIKDQFKTYIAAKLSTNS